MTLQQLVNVHTATVHTITETQDASLGIVESIGASTATKQCKFVPKTAWQQKADDQLDHVEQFQVLFDHNPSLTQLNVLKRNSKYYRVRSCIDQGGNGLLWIADVEHIPQMEITP